MVRKEWPKNKCDGRAGRMSFWLATGEKATAADISKAGQTH